MARAGEPSARVLEELAYEKVCVGIALCDLMRFEHDLDVSLHRALQLCSSSEKERDELLSRSFERACARYHDEITDPKPTRRPSP